MLQKSTLIFSRLISSGRQDVDILVLAHKRGHDEGPPRCGDLKWPSMGPIKCFSVCSYRKILERRLFKSFYVKTFNTSWPAVCRMGCNYILSCPTHALADGVNHISLFWVFFLTMWSSINTRCTPSLPNMVSALILVLLWKWNQIVMKHSWDSKSPKQWIQVWLMIITDFLGPMDCFTSSYPYLFTWNVTLYKILLWLKFDEIPSKVCHSPRTYHTHRKEVSQAFDPTLEEGIKQ